MTAGWQSWLAVGVGSGLGGLGRYGVSLLSKRAIPGLWSGVAGTLAVNLVGSVLLAWLLARQQDASPDALRLGLTTGVMGGFTTYSTFNAEVVGLLHSGRGREAVGYVLTTVAVCLLGGWLGYLLGGGASAAG